MATKSDLEGLEVPEKDRARLWHVYPGYEHMGDPSPPVGTPALCGWRKRDTSRAVRFTAGEPDDCVVCDALAGLLSV